MTDDQPTLDAATERDQLRAALLDIDAHATPYGDIPNEAGWVGTYLVTAGALHRALGKIGHTAPSCAAEAALALLHEGEEPYEDPRLVPTPAQWIWKWNRATPQERLATAEEILQAWERVDRCHFGDHRRRLEGLRETLARVEAFAHELKHKDAVGLLIALHGEPEAAPSKES